MPGIYEPGEILSLVGIICDICEKEDRNFCNDFVLRHTFGYGSRIDGNSVEAAICDDCLEKLIRKNIPKASWTKA